MDIIIKTLPLNNLKWIDDLRSALNAAGFKFETINEEGYTLIYVMDSAVVLNLINIDSKHIPQTLINIQQSFYSRGLSLIHLWEDVFRNKPLLVLERIKSLAGKNSRIHGRKTRVLKIDKPRADAFLNENHLQGAVSSRHKFGLFFGDELVAVATFSALRKMNHTENYKSIELIRFAVKAGFSVSGGLSKLLVYIRKNLNPDDIMSYADRDWSAGASYLKLGFEQVSYTNAQTFELDTNLSRSLSKAVVQNNKATVFNTGSIKFILKF
ncbi:hypothetical protein [Pedobacter sp. Leaf132]|uniref:hypothetical protein n=1 Tax=Pedobacter sp. Leaf132 TaxID=2876557 RepID=UPI001E30D354|nr:hypothetical protein [Pedobacter sp. Leaf132]